MRYALKQRLILGLAPRAAWLTLRSLTLASPVTVIDQQHFDAVRHQHGTVLVGFWHETLSIALSIYRKKGYYTLTSKSFDGELAARTCEAFGLHALRGSSSRGGVEALRTMIRKSQSVPGIGFTLDGPRGPRRVAKPGIALVSARTGIPIIPNAIVATRCWRLRRSWDRMAFPKPFSRLLCAYGEPIPPPADTQPTTLESTRLEVEKRLNELHEKLDPGGSSPA